MSFSFDYTYDYFPIVSFLPLTTSNSVSDNISVTLYPLWFKQISLQWTIPARWGACHFNVYKGPTENGPFVKLNAAILGTSISSFKDITTQQYSKFIKDYYIVEVILSTGKRIQSSPKTWENVRSNFANIRATEITRREWLLLRKFTGVSSYILSRRTYGKRCHNCWNQDLEKIIKDKCQFCSGTSFEGGYFEAVPTFLQYDPSPNDIKLTYFGKWEINDLLAWTINIPSIKTRDLIYRVSDGALFEVRDWNQTTLQDVTVRQIMQLTQLDKESPEYQVVLDNNLIPSQFQV